MRREDIADLTAFVAVAEEGSFTRAAARIGLSQSALSQIVRRLEERLGVRLLARTTRSVATTQAGEQLLATLAPRFQEIETGIAAIAETEAKPAGIVRLTAGQHAACRYVVPALGLLLADNPGITVEVDTDYALRDIVTSHFDAGVRLGEQIEKDMIAVPISPPIAMAIVASPAYLDRSGTPVTPRELARHSCINLRLPTSGSFLEWRLSKGGKAVHVRLEGAIISNSISLIEQAVLSGTGIAYLPLDQVESYLSDGSLVRIMKEWSEDLPPYHLYYPHRRQGSAAFRLVVDALRWRN